MSYVRPPMLDSAEFTLVLGTGSFPGAGVDRFGPFAVSPFNAGQKTIYVAVYDNRAPGSSAQNVRHEPVVYRATNDAETAADLIALTAPDTSAVAGPYTVTDDYAAWLAALGSGTHEVFYDSAATGDSWPAGAELEFLGKSLVAPDTTRSTTSTMEVFVWTPGTGGGGDGGGGDEDGECPPYVDWPYLDPGMAMTAAPAGAIFVAPGKR